MTIGAAWTRARTRLSPYRAQLRFCLRMTAAALLAFALAQIWNIPLNGLWAVLTAVVVTQMSVGGSLHATTEYLLGTIGGAIYAATIGVLIPHPTTLGLAGVLALTIAPLAFAAAVNPSFRSAPFPSLARVAECTSKYLHESASALRSRRPPPPLKPM
jgi:uncharacterized membrane protein YccC